MKTKICGACSEPFPISMFIDGKWKTYSKRVYCLKCSPAGTKDKRHPKDRLKDLDGCRVCSTCKERKPLNDKNFSKSTIEKTGFRWLCKPCASKRVTTKQKELKLKCVQYKGGKCVKCGYSKSMRALHFHHTDPSKKKFTLAKYRSRSWITTKAELDKCILVCANCHAELHD